jgi:hypothetical protein
MADTSIDYHVINQGAAITHSHRAGNRPVQVPRDLPGIVIFIHGVNDPGAAYSVVEKGLCQGLNERLSRGDLMAGSYGAQHRAVASRPGDQIGINDAIVLNDPDTYLYKRDAVPSATHSIFIPFYWGYRAADDEIARVDNPGEVISRTADADGNLMTRGQYQDIRGNRLDAHFAKGGGFFANATNNIPDMYGEGFKADWITRQVTRNALGGNALYAADAPDRRYFVLAATRLANLISTIRTIKSKPAAEAEGMNPAHETITVIGHSQGTILTLLAQAILKQQGQRCADSLIMVDTPYSVYEADDCSQTGHAKLKTLIDIVNAVTEKPYDIPSLAELLIGNEKCGGRTGHGWTPMQGKRLDRSGKNWIAFDERDNRGKVYLYFCPEDTVVGLKKVRGIGTFGVPDEVPADGEALRADPQKNTMAAMTALAPRRFFQRMWTRMERDRTGNGEYEKVLVGTAPARVPVRKRFERRTPGPDAGASMLATAAAMGTNIALQASFAPNDVRFINGEELKPPCEPHLYGGEVVRGGPRPGHADIAGSTAPDEVTKNVVLGNQYAKLEWVTNSHSANPVVDLERRKKEFNEGKPIDEQSWNWKIGGSEGIGGAPLLREETPKEARKRMESDPAAYEANNYHSAVLRSTENHRWVTAMDVAIGQAVTLDDPVWRELLILLADWKMNRSALKRIKENSNYARLPDETKELIEACVAYYRTGKFPTSLVDSVPPALVTSELTPKAKEAQQQAFEKRMAQEQRFYQDQMSRNWGAWSNLR